MQINHKENIDLHRLYAMHRHFGRF
jgi:hypothetical protein